MMRREKGSHRGPCDPRARPGRAPQAKRAPQDSRRPGSCTARPRRTPTPSLPTPRNEPPARCHEEAHAAGLVGDWPGGGGLRPRNLGTVGGNGSQGSAKKPGPRFSAGTAGPGRGGEARAGVCGLDSGSSGGHLGDGVSEKQNPRPEQRASASNSLA